jgi:hypothetical protein
LTARVALNAVAVRFRVTKQREAGSVGKPFRLPGEPDPAARTPSEV